MMSRKKVYVVFPITIPGMKKIVFFTQLKEAIESRGFKYSMRANKDVKEECRNELMETYSDLSEEKLKYRTDMMCKDVFKAKLAALIAEEKGLPESRVHFIYIEKNHPPNGFNTNLKFIRDQGRNIDLQIIALVPLLNGEPITVNSGNQEIKFPFTPRLFLSCLDRVQNRAEHPTLRADGAKSLEVELYFLQMFRNFDFDGTYLKEEFTFNKVVSVPFTPEESKAQPIPEELLKALKVATTQKNKEGSPASIRAAEKLFEVYERCDFELVEPESAVVREIIDKFLDNEILPEVDPEFLAKKMENLKLKDKETFTNK